MGIVTNLEALRMKRDAARAASDRERMTAEDKEEADLRAEIAKLQGEARAKDRAALELALERREDAARDELGPGVPVKSIVSEDGTHGFVLRYAGSKPFSAWERDSALSFVGGKDPRTHKLVDGAAANKSFALALVWERLVQDPATLQWIQKRITPASNEHAELAALFDSFGGIASAISLAGRELSGAAMEARKS